MADQIVISDFHGGITTQVGNASHADNRMSEVKPCADIRRCQHAGVFHYSAAIHMRAPLDRGAAGHDRSRANPRRRPDESRGNDARAGIDADSRRNPHAGSDLSTIRPSLGFERKNVDAELPQVASVGQRIHVTGVNESRTLAAALAETAAEQRSRVIAPPCANSLNVSSAVRQKLSATQVRHSKSAGEELLRGRKERPAAITAVTREIPQCCKRSTTRNRELFPAT